MLAFGSEATTDAKSPQTQWFSELFESFFSREPAIGSERSFVVDFVEGVIGSVCARSRVSAGSTHDFV